MYIAVDVGGTKTLVSVLDEHGTVIRQEKNPTNSDYSKFIDETVEVILRLQDGVEVKVVAVAVPGHIEEDGIVKEFGNLDWHNVDIKEDLSAKFTVPVIIDNDANMGALGEANLGAGQGHKVCLYVTISTGIGTGVTIDGRISPALKESEGGFVQVEKDGESVSWESVASGKAFLERFGKQGKDVDDPDVWKEFAADVALGLEDNLAIIQPDIVVVGGSMGVHFKKYEEFLIENLHQMKNDSPTVDLPPVVQASDPDNAVINGCFVAARYHALTT